MNINLIPFLISFSTFLNQPNSLGIFIALLLRFDAKKCYDNNNGIFSKVYFKSAYAAYFIGLATTVLVMHHWQAAQVGYTFFYSLVRSHSPSSNPFCFFTSARITLSGSILHWFASSSRSLQRRAKATDILHRRK